MVLVAEEDANVATATSSSVSVLVVTACSAIPVACDVPIRLGFLLLVAVLLVAVVVDPLLLVVVLKLCPILAVAVTENPATPTLGCDVEGSGSAAHNNNTRTARPRTMVVCTTEDAERSLEEEEGRFRTIMTDTMKARIKSKQSKLPS